MFWRNKIKEIEHAIDETIDTANNAHERIRRCVDETQNRFLRCAERCETIEFNIQDLYKKLTELEEHSKNKWESTTKRVETCEKANEMFIKALNEQRDVIGKIIKFLNNSSKTNNTTKSKKGAK